METAFRISNFAKEKRDAAKGIRWLIYLGLFGILSCLVGALIIFVAIPVKICATVVGIFRKPLSCLRNIPANWVKQVARTDTTLMPEMLPGVRAWVRTRRGHGKITEVIAGPDIVFKSSLRYTSRHSALFFTLFFFPILFLPFAFGLLYRWALKATALVWLPLVFFLHGAFRKHDSLAWRVADLMKGPLAVFLRCYAGCVLFLNGLLPLFLRTLYLDVTTWLQAKMFPDVLMRYFLLRPTAAVPQTLVVEAWHVAGLLSAAITLLLYVCAGSLCNRMDNGGFLNDEEKRSSLRKIQYTLAARAILTTYTIVCGVVAFAKAANWEWAQFTVRWLP